MMHYKWYIINIILITFIIITNLTSTTAQSGTINFIFDYQDPAGDVLMFNATENGTPVEGGTEVDSLDIKWINSKEDGSGNVILTMDLKGKNRFTNEDETKYVFRILTSPDNSTGYNITYSNGSAKMNSFTRLGNKTTIDITDKVSFTIDKGDEKIEVLISKALFLLDISYYSLDAYSMQVTSNNTLLDYISELPGHPEYINPDVQDAEDLDSGNDGGAESGSDEILDTYSILGLALGFVVVCVVIVIVIFASKRK